MHRAKLGNLELLHASRVATFGLLGFGLLVAGISSLLGKLTFSITVKGTSYRHLVELEPAWILFLLLGGLASLAVVTHSLVRIERLQNRIIDMKLRSDEEAEAILRYDYQDYKKESDLRYAISPLLMALSLIVSGMGLNLWLNKVVLDSSLSLAILVGGVVFGGLSLADHIILHNRLRKG